MKDSKDKKRKGALPTQTGLIFRILVGVYVLWIAYTIGKDIPTVEGNEAILFGAMAVVFCIASFGIIIMSVKALKNGAYVGGTADVSDEQAETQDAEDKDPNGTFQGAGAESEEKPKRIKFGEREE